LNSKDSVKRELAERVLGRMKPLTIARAMTEKELIREIEKKRPSEQFFVGGYLENALAERYKQTKSIEELEKAVEQTEGTIRDAEVKALTLRYADLGPKGIPKLKKLINKTKPLGIADVRLPDPVITVPAERALVRLYSRMGDRGLAELAKLFKAPYSGLQATARKEIMQRGTEVLELLEGTFPENFFSKKKYGNFAFAPGFLELVQKVSELQLDTGANGRRKLEKLATHPNKDVREIAQHALGRKKARRRLLASRKSFASSAFLKTLLGKTRRLRKISETLEREFGEKFVGIVVVGSFVKGSFGPLSDLDYAVISYSPRAGEKFLELAGEHFGHQDMILPTKPETGWEHEVDSEHNVVDPKKANHPVRRSVFFSGIFFGNRERLSEAQRIVFQNTSKKKWEEMRTVLRNRELDLKKAFERLGTTSKSEQANALKAAALRIPPTYNEMKAIIPKRKRVKKT